jgi:DNA-directed RNA polymerase subunit RPC12/RpoP
MKPNQVKTHCAACGKELIMAASLKKEHNFCNLTCYGNFYNGREKVEKVKCICATCGKEFYRIPSKVKGALNYCSRDCHFPNKVIPQEYVCINCGKPFISRYWRHANKFCCRECNAEYKHNNRTTQNPGEFTECVTKIANYFAISPYTVLRKGQKLKIINIFDQIIDPKIPVKDRRDLLYRNAKTEPVENVADVMWEKIMDHELGIA